MVGLFTKDLKTHGNFGPLKVNNIDAINPLFEEGKCDRPFFYFQELLKEENQQQNYKFINPCDTGFVLPSTINTFVHTRPTLAFSNSSWNPPTRALLATFDETGKAATQSVEEQSHVDAVNFDGYSAIPGFFYNNGNFPEKYHHQLFVADYSGWIKTFSFDENNKITGVADFMTREKGIVGLAQNKKDGCLYYIHFSTHTVNKICFGGNPPPVAIISVDKNYGASPLEIQFDAKDSNDPFGEDISYFWDFEDGITSDLVNPTFTFTTSKKDPVPKIVKLIVTDEAGNTGETEQIISINNTPPQVNIISFADSDQYPISTSSILQLAAEVSDKEHQEGELTYTWQVFLHHNEHFHAEPELHKKATQIIISPLGCVDANYWYRIRLKVSDGAGLEGVDEKEIFPNCGAPIVTDFKLKGKAFDEGNRLNWDFINNTNNIDRVEIFRGTRINDLIPMILNISPDTKEFLDKKPLNGLNYYLLKIIAKDGVYDFSNLISLEFPPDPLIQIFPNPISGSTFQLGLREAYSDKILLKIYNAVGQQVADYQLNAIKNAEFLQTVSSPKLANGIYWYEVENGELVYGGKLVIGVF